MYQIVKWSVIGLGLIVVQLVVLPALVPPIWTPQLLVVLIIAIMWRWSVGVATVMAIFVGLLMDIAALLPFGSHGLWLVATMALSYVVHDTWVGYHRPAQIIAQMLVIALSVGAWSSLMSGVHWEIIPSIVCTTFIAGGVLIMIYNVEK